MKRFVCKFLIFFILFTAPLLTINQLYKSTNFYNSMNELYWLRKFPDNIELLTLGNSHARAGIRFNETYAGIAHNFATSSQPFYYDYQVLKYVRENVLDDGIVLIQVSLFDWFYNYKELFLEDAGFYNKRYYSLLPSRSILYYDFEEDVKYHYLPVLTAKSDLKYIFNDIPLPKTDSADFSININHVVSSATWKYDSWINHVMSIEEKVIDDNVYWFGKIIDYCYESGFIPVAVITPIPSTLSSMFSADILNQFRVITQHAIEEYPELLCLNYFDDPVFSENLKLYKDADHLNTYGALALTTRILNDLKKYGYIAGSKIINQ